MSNLETPPHESVRSRRLDELFADQPFLSPTMRASTLHERAELDGGMDEGLDDEPPAMMIPVLAEMGDDDVIRRLCEGRQKRLHAVTVDMDDPAWTPPVASVREPVTEPPARNARRGKRPAAVRVEAPAGVPLSGDSLRIELMVDNTCDPPRISAVAHPTPQGPEVMTPREAAEFLRLGVSTLREWAREGRLPSVKLGRQVRFRRTALLEWMAQREAR